MTAQPLPEYLTLAQYNRVIFRPDAHFAHGPNVARTLGDSTHSDLVGNLIGEPYPACKEAGLSCCISLRLQTSLTRIRVCDFVVLQATAPREQVPTVAPRLCIEVLSPGQSPREELDALAKDPRIVRATQILSAVHEFSYRSSSE